MKRLVRAAAILASLTLCAVLLRAVFVPGPQHAIWPARSGLTEIGPGVWTDAPERKIDFLEMLEQARQEAESFYGFEITPRRIILCASAPCARRMGFGTVGLTYGAHLVLIGPGGLNKSVIGHELSHIALNGMMDPTDLLSPRFPAWFNEGLAVHLFSDSRYNASSDPDWVRAARTFRDWRRLVTAENWPQAYGDAGALVTAYAEQHGLAGLRSLITDVANGADFNRRLAGLDD